MIGRAAPAEDEKSMLNNDYRKSLKKLKSLHVGSKVMMNYDVSKPTCLYADHGPGGVVATVAQGYEGESGKLVYCPVHHNSWAIMETDQRYSKVEGE